MLDGGANTVFWTQGAAPTIVDSGLQVTSVGASVTGAIVTIGSGLLPGDQLSLTAQSGIAATYDPATGTLTLSGTASAAAYQAALEQIVFSSTATDPTSNGTDLTRLIAFQVGSSNAASNTVSSSVDVGGLFNLSAGADAVTAGLGDDAFVARSNTLGSGDRLEGGAGANSLQLTGAGGFNLAAPASFANIQSVIAAEGQAAAPGFAAQNQILTLRTGTSATIQVVANPAHQPGNARPDSITIVGANNSDVINLGPGTDTVTVGGPGETVMAAVAPTRSSSMPPQSAPPSMAAQEPASCS